jgi:hypothetical protein
MADSLRRLDDTCYVYRDIHFDVNWEYGRDYVVTLYELHSDDLFFLLDSGFKTKEDAIQFAQTEIDLVFDGDEDSKIGLHKWLNSK